MRDFRFSDGTLVPKGNYISVACGPMHGDSDLYPDAGKFDGFRFWKLGEEEGLKDEGSRHLLVTTSPDYVSFGYGRHAW